MKRNISITLAVAAAMVLGGGALSAYGASGYLGLTRYAQEQSNWCWAATSKSIAAYYTGAPATQCDLVKWGKVSSSCPDTTGDFGIDVYRALMGGGVSDPGTVSSGAMDFVTIKGEISVGRPSMIRWGWKSTGLSTGHMLNIVGWSDAPSGTAQTVNLINPDGGTGITAAWYWVAEDSSHKWTHSRYYILP